MDENAEKYVLYVRAPRKRPDLRLLIAFLWGDEHNVDSDGNATNPASHTWTQLTLESRQTGEWVSIDIYKRFPLILEVHSRFRQITARTAYFLAKQMNSKISRKPLKNFEPPESFIVDMGRDFNLNLAWRRFQDSPFIRATTRNPYPNLEAK